MKRKSERRTFMGITTLRAIKNRSLILKALMILVIVLLMGSLSLIWAQPREQYRPKKPYYYDRYERRWHDREWYERHRHDYRYYPPPPVYAPPPVVYAPPPPPPGISIILPPIIIR
jgi:hypothetical protein